MPASAQTWSAYNQTRRDWEATHKRIHLLLNDGKS